MFDDWQSAVALIGAIVGVYAAIVWLGIIVWTYRDIRGRTHDTWSQAVAVLLVALFNIPGLFLYLILRPHETLSESYERRLETEMIRQEMIEHRRACPSCQLPVQSDFLLCPNCRTTLQEPCVVCNRPLSLDWAVCPYCGTQGPKSAPARAPAYVTPPPPQPQPSAAAAPSPLTASQPAAPRAEPRAPEPAAAPNPPHASQPALPPAEQRPREAATSTRPGDANLSTGRRRSGKRPAPEPAAAEPTAQASGQQAPPSPQTRSTP